jgi:Flp pilus assembly pilin Flp
MTSNQRQKTASTSPGLATATLAHAYTVESRPGTCHLLCLYFSRTTRRIQKFIADEDGASVVEYGVLIALVIAACIAIIFILGGQIRDGFQSFKESLDAVGMKPPAAT